MRKTVLLCHVNSSVLQLWQKAVGGDFAFNAPKDISALLTNFIGYVNEMNLDVVLSFESKNDVTTIIKQGLTVISTELTFAHEISLLKKIFSDKNIESVYYLDSIFPVADMALTKKLNEIHGEYCADYSFIENAPAGLTGVFFSRSLFEAMQIEEGERSETPDIDNAIPDSMPVGLREYVEKNINHFHVEIHYEHPDLRILRLDFSGKTLRSIQSCADVFKEYGAIHDYYIELEKLYNKNPELLHHFPSYLELEIYGGCEFACSFCARQFVSNHDDQMMTPGDIENIVKFIDSGLGDTSVALGGLGEPLEHPKAGEILGALLSQKFIPAIVVETNGRHLDKIFFILDHPEIHKLRIVVNINSITGYEQMHGAKSGDKEIVIKNIERCRDLLAQKNESFKKNIYIQTLKILDNEKELDEIYDLADKTGISFLLQKYNSYVGLMPEKRVSDMTPLERFFCWHLRRDLYIKADGGVVYCKQDAQNSKIRGNIRNTPIEEIWKTTIDDWKNNYGNRYPEIPDCKNCDEYYTFNM
jgi:spiro-SPASM protein